MKKKKLIIPFLFILILCFSLVSLIYITQAQSVYSKKIFGSNYPVVRLISSIDFKPNNNINKIVIEEIVYNSQKYQICCYEINPGKSKKVLLSASVHGEEPAGAYALIEIIDQAKKYSEKYPDLTLEIIPIMNPWGFTRDIRYNYNGINIGVDFTLQKSREAKAIINYIKTKRYDCVIDLHENRSRGNFILSFDLKETIFLKDVIKDLRNDGYPISSSPTMKIFKWITNEQGICFYPRTALLAQLISSRETLFVWLKNRGKSKKIYAFESGSNLKLDVRKMIDIIVIERILDKLNEEK